MNYHDHFAGNNHPFYKSCLEYALSLSKETKWHGNHDENGRYSVLKAGCLSMVYENGSLRYISIGNREIIRMIYSSLRDKEWLTIKPIISEEEFDLHPDSFRIRYCCQYKSREIDFSALCTIEGNADNSLIFSFEGEAMNAFEKNRIGFCVLHPVEAYAGETCVITHSNEDVQNIDFPRFISPHQPFRDIKSMKWKFFNHNCTLDFYGDIFETEDQRNWTDASYKTYCTPLDRPFPVKLQKSEKIIQKIELKIEGDFDMDKGDNAQIEITIRPEKFLDLPKIGIGRSTRPEPLSEREIQTLGKLRFDHYRVDLCLFSTDWRYKAELAADEAVRLEYAIEFALFFDENAVNQYTEFIDWISGAHPDIALIVLYHKTQGSTPDLLTDTLAPLFKEALPGVRIGCGTNANFAQLNRNRPGSAYNDYLCYSIHPQEHASDNTTLIENLQPQGYTVRSAWHFAEGREIWISPVNIQRRFNANIENYEQPGSVADFPPQIDSRLMSLFGACWTAGSLKYLSEAGVKGVTFYETAGERGIIQGDLPSRWPEKFKSEKGMIFPVYFVLRYLLEYKSFKVIKSVCSNPLKVESLVLSDGTHIKVILTNFTSVQQNVNIHGSSGNFTIKELNAENFASAVTDSNWIENTPKKTVNLNEQILLNPFSVSFIDRKIKV
jgi:hypothetical protein